MKAKRDLRLLAGRLGITFVVAFVFVLLINEGSYLVLKDRQERPPQTVELVIPAGTAQQIAKGKAVPGVPADLTLMSGDVLVVRNNDVVDHQIGPVWVPPGRSASLEMDQPDKYAYACSFQPSRYLGLDVRQPTTLGTRLTALGLAVPPTTMFLFVYSLLLYPLDRTPRANQGPLGDEDERDPSGDSILGGEE